MRGRSTRRQAGCRSTRVRAVVVAAVAVAALAGSCSPATDGGQGLRVVASAYPLAEAAERVGGDLVSVRNLTPPGVEPHDLELAPDDLEALLSSDLVLLVGGGFQPAVEEAAGEAEGRVLEALDVVEPLSLSDGGVDPHVWLDPVRYAAIVDRIAGVLTDADPAHAETYAANAATFEDELTALDGELRDGLASCESRLLVVSHAAFGYLADAYDLRQEPISGLSPEAEPDPARLAELMDLVRREGVTTVFTEELVSPDVAETLAQEAGVTTAVLNPLEGLTRSELDAGQDYGSVMRRNLETLRGALGCA